MWLWEEVLWAGQGWEGHTWLTDTALAHTWAGHSGAPGSSNLARHWHFTEDIGGGIEERYLEEEGPMGKQDNLQALLWSPLKELGRLLM